MRLVDYRRFFIYACVGVVGTGAHYSVLVFCVKFWSITPVIASTFGMVAGAIVNYCLNRWITFKSSRPHSKAALSFALIAIFAALINAGLMYLFVDFFSLHYLVAQIFASGGVLVTTYTLNSLFTFKSS